jgi:FAD/FMN-containing dehydrogenase
LTDCQFLARNARKSRGRRPARPRADAEPRRQEVATEAAARHRQGRRGLSDEVISLLIRAMENTAGDLDQILIETHGGAISRVAKDATAFEHRDARFNLGIFAVSTNPALDEADKAWARHVYQQILPHSTGGSYVNYLSEGDDVHTAYGDARFQRLAGIKARYDPGNLFRFNHNIAPA